MHRIPKYCSKCGEKLESNNELTKCPKCGKDFNIHQARQSSNFVATLNTVAFLGFLKKSEPVGVLASLSLVIATFTYDHIEFAAIYDFSVTASFMFFISFIFSYLLLTNSGHRAGFYFSS